MSTETRPSWLTVGVSALVSAAVAVLVAFATNWFQDKTEHEKWLRDQQQVAYTEFASASNNCYWNHIRGPETLPSCISELQSKLVAVDLVGTSAASREALDTLNTFRGVADIEPGEVYDGVEDQLLELSDQFRNDLILN